VRESTHSGSSWRGHIHAKAEPYFSTPMPPEWVPVPALSSRYVWRRYIQYDNQGFLVVEFYISPTKRAFSMFAMLNRPAFAG
jgi:hypothetical protein